MAFRNIGQLKGTVLVSPLIVPLGEETRSNAGCLGDDSMAEVSRCALWLEQSQSNRRTGPPCYGAGPMRPERSLPSDDVLLLSL